jgi:hypothetical protein
VLVGSIFVVNHCLSLKLLNFHEEEYKSPASSIPLLEITLGRSSIPSKDAPRQLSNHGSQATPSWIHWLYVVGRACIQREGGGSLYILDSLSGVRNFAGGGVIESEERFTLYSLLRDRPVFFFLPCLFNGSKWQVRE